MKVDTLSKISQFVPAEIWQFRFFIPFTHLFIYLFLFQLNLSIFKITFLKRRAAAPLRSDSRLRKTKKAISVNKESKGIEFEDIVFD